MSLVANEEFQHILRVLNTNVDGKQKIMFALTSIKGIGRRFANIVCKKADVDMNKRAGELSAAELENLMVIVANPRQFKIPDWFLNRKKDYKDGRYSQVVSNALDMKLRDDLERLKKIRLLFPMLSIMILLFEHRTRSLSCYMNPLISVNLQHFSYVSWILVMLLLTRSMFSLSLYSSFVLSSYD
ncbi:hypothetical protein PVL29_024444 [Vitis rotundifolia]|uniref:40S ribosomal protein S18 n=1 Tax=Vitis rotundifolia TaxID=103349 RepID=A0AA39D894_VITRO|nr:hypothetical protein PVL29_024444 [Vitis rotundifolia]